MFIEGRGDGEDRATVNSTRSGHRSRTAREAGFAQGSEAHVGQRDVDGLSVRGRVGGGKREYVERWRTNVRFLKCYVEIQSV